VQAGGAVLAAFAGTGACLDGAEFGTFLDLGSFLESRSDLDFAGGFVSGFVSRFVSGFASGLFKDVG
jgi:hypothetical protein